MNPCSVGRFSRPARSLSFELLDGLLAPMIHERFCCERGFAAATCLSAGGLAARSLDILFKDAFLPHGSAHPSRVATPHFRDEPS